MKITPKLINQIMRALDPIIKKKVRLCYDRRKLMKYAKQRCAVEQYRKARDSKVASDEARSYADSERVAGRSVTYRDALAIVEAR